jgi:hypothetical protein
VRRRKGRQQMCVEGATKILEACKEIVNGEVNLESWENKIRDEAKVEFDEDEQPEVGELFEKNHLFQTICACASFREYFFYFDYILSFDRV